MGAIAGGVGEERGREGGRLRSTGAAGRMSSGDDDARVREWRGASSWERFHQDQGAALHHRRTMPSSQYARPGSFGGGGAGASIGSVGSSFGRTGSSKQLSGSVHPSQPCVGVDRGGCIISW